MGRDRLMDVVVIENAPLASGPTFAHAMEGAGQCAKAGLSGFRHQVLTGHRVPHHTEEDREKENEDDGG